MSRTDDALRGRTRRGATRRKIRYAVVGLGHIAQAAVLPAFANAKSNSELAALVSDDPRKLKTLGRRYSVSRRCAYAELDDLLASGDIDAVYIALPNSQHREFTERAAAAGVHVLCEKPMAVTPAECERMIAARDRHGIKLMIAYRLHFEIANLRAVELVRSGKLGEVRFFGSTFSMQVRDRDNIRLKADLGGGPLHDIGIYCINAARMILRAEPEEVFAEAVGGRAGEDDRFVEVPEMVSAVLRYPQGRLATFTCSFGAADISRFEVAGARGSLVLDGAFDYANKRTLEARLAGGVDRRRFAVRDQFAPELLYFSRCILRGTDPEPSAEEGLADVQIIAALRRSIRLGGPVPLEVEQVTRHPTPRQQIDRPPVRKRRTIAVSSPKG